MIEILLLILLAIAISVAGFSLSFDDESEQEYRDYLWEKELKRIAREERRRKKNDRL